MGPTEQDRILEDTHAIRQQVFEEAEETKIERLVQAYRAEFSLSDPTGKNDFMSFEDFQDWCKTIKPSVSAPTVEDYIEVYLSAHPYAMTQIADDDIGKLSRVFDKIPIKFFFNTDKEVNDTVEKILQLALVALKEDVEKEVFKTDKAKNSFQKSIESIRNALSSGSEEDEQSAMENLSVIMEQRIDLKTRLITSPEFERLVLKKSALLSRELFDENGNCKPRFLELLRKRKGSSVEGTLVRGEKIIHQLESACVLVAMSGVSSENKQVRLFKTTVVNAIIMPDVNKLREEPDTRIRSQQLFGERSRIVNFLREQGIRPKSGVKATNDDLARLLLPPNGGNTKQFREFVKANFENAAAIIPRDLDAWYTHRPWSFIPFVPRRSFSRIDTGKSDEIKFLSSEHTLERMEGMVAEAIKAARQQPPNEHPLKIHLHILSVLDKSNPKDKAKIDNVDAIANFVLATYKSKHPDVDLQITHETASMPDHQMRESNGELLHFDTMDKYLSAHRGHPEPGVHQAYNIHCKAGQGRSATAMMCEDIRYNGLSPSESSAQIKKSRPKAHGVDSKGSRPDQRCFVYSYFFNAAAEALDPSKKSTPSSRLRERFEFTRNSDEKSGFKQSEINALVREVKGALSIDYKHKVNMSGGAKADIQQWADQLTKSFLEFREQYKKATGVDLLDKVIIDYAKDPNKYSKAQKQNLTRVLSAAGYQELDRPDILIGMMMAKNSESPPRTPPSLEALKALAVAMIKSAEPLSFLERINPFNKRKPMLIARDQLMDLCRLGDIKSSELPPRMRSYTIQDAHSMSDKDRMAAVARMAVSIEIEKNPLHRPSRDPVSTTPVASVPSSRRDVVAPN